jgi:hypothetical protein
LKTDYSVILDVRTSAHRFDQLRSKQSLFDAHQFPMETDVRSNSEADTGSSGCPYQRDMQC